MIQEQSGGWVEEIIDILFIVVAVVLYLLKQRDVIMCTVYPYSWKCLLSHDSSCNGCINMISRYIEYSSIGIQVCHTKSIVQISQPQLYLKEKKNYDFSF